MAANYTRVPGTGSVNSALSNAAGPRAAAPAGPKGDSSPKDRRQEEDKSHTDIFAGALEKLIRDDGSEQSGRDGGNTQKPVAKAPVWEELLGESNDRVRFSAIQTKRLSTKELLTPSVLGQTLKDAVSTLKAAGLSITKIVQEYSHDVATGRVMVQLPSPGGSATKRMGVAVVVSKGPLPDADYDFAANLKPKGRVGPGGDAWQSEG